MANPNSDQAVSFQEVFEAELTEIAESRQRRSTLGGGHQTPAFPTLSTNNDAQGKEEVRSSLLGLSFSGGGIRSATFNLGVLQALAQMNLLPRFDYLSTVSGGGYIGSWFQACLRRKGPAQLIEQLKQDDAKPDNPIQFLRRYSNYLTPSRGLMSADTWALASIYTRNLVLNQLVLISMLAAILMVPKLAAILLFLPANVVTESAGLGRLVLGAIIVTLLGVAWMIGRNLAFFCDPGKASKPMGPGEIQMSIVIPLLVISALLGNVIGAHVPAGESTDLLETRYLWAIPAGTLTAMLFLLGLFSGFRPFRILLVATAGAGVAGAFAFGMLVKILGWMNTQGASGPWQVLVFGPPLVLLALSLSIVVYIGLLGKDFPDERREWWSRLGAWLLIYMLGWTALFSISIYGPLATAITADWLGAWLATGISITWVVTTVLGVLAGNSGKTDGPKNSSIFNTVATIAPYLFVAGLLLLISVASHFGLAYFAFPDDVFTNGWNAFRNDSTAYWALHWQFLETEWAARIIGFAIVFLAGCGLGLRVDINEFSMHHFYRNRLVRCYLGASRNRDPHPFTAFDPCDDAPLNMFQSKPAVDYRDDLKPDICRPQYAGPYPIINATLNLVQGKELAWQQRKAASFVFTPKYCGYQLEGEVTRGERPKAYRETAGYPDSNGPTIGTAFAISGAAASPNMGYHSSIPVGFLMTMFNVRLGWWLPNPGAGKPKLPSASQFLLFRELLGLTDEESKYVYISDGGHFENLGVYELVRRQCRFIVASDGAQDGKLRHDDLGGLIRKVRTDFGIDIEIDLKALKLAEQTRQTAWHCAVGRIRYDQLTPPRPVGMLLYIKSSITGDEDADVLNYAATQPDFPHESTADQWFDEMQFESYRKLGNHIATQTLKPTVAHLDLGQTTNEELFSALHEAWFPPSSAAATTFTRHGQALDAIFERLRNDKTLRFLDDQFYPQWKYIFQNGNPHAGVSPLSIPSDPEQLRHGFYFCMSLIQLMENVYTDLNLTSNLTHPDNRGWMNLFRHWSWSGMFRVTWAVTASTFGARFQTFCRQHLGLAYEDCLKIDEPIALNAPADYASELAKSDALNFLEKGLIRRLGTPVKVYVLRMLIADVWKAGGVELSLPFGFAATVENSPGEDQLVLFRIQDHVRRMGLGRRSLTRLLERPEFRHLATSTSPGFNKDRILMVRKELPARALDEVPEVSELRNIIMDTDSPNFRRLFEFARGEAACKHIIKLQLSDEDRSLEEASPKRKSAHAGT